MGLTLKSWIRHISLRGKGVSIIKLQQLQCLSLSCDEWIACCVQFMNRVLRPALRNLAAGGAGADASRSAGPAGCQAASSMPFFLPVLILLAATAEPGRCRACDQSRRRVVQPRKRKGRLAPPFPGYCGYCLIRTCTSDARTGCGRTGRTGWRMRRCCRSAHRSRRWRSAAGSCRRCC